MLRLRDYRPTDFEAIWSLDQLCFDPAIAYSKIDLTLYLALPGAFAIVAEKDREIVGFVVAHLSRAAGYVITIDVHPKARTQKIGSRLMKAAERKMRAKAARSIHLEVAVNNVPAIAFYQHHGFRIVRTIPRYYNDALDAYRMLKKL